MDKAKIVTLLKDYNAQDVEKFSSYLVKLSAEKDRKTGARKNLWIDHKTDAELAELFRQVDNDGLVFDGQHITLQSTGISYDYIAYKNKMLIVYPESTIDINLVYEGDVFEITRTSGKVLYKHDIKEPFKRTADKIIGGYCIIKNSRGESSTMLSKEDIDKHRKVAKTDYIWQDWFAEMALKTIIKKACKLHYADIFKSIEEKDNENYNVENPLDLEIELKAEIDACKDIKELTVVYNKYKGKVTNTEPFNKYIGIKKMELNKECPPKEAA